MVKRVSEAWCILPLCFVIGLATTGLVLSGLILMGCVYYPEFDNPIQTRTSSPAQSTPKPLCPVSNLSFGADGQIETDHVQITTSTTLTSPPQPSITHSPHSRPSSPILPPPSSPKSAMGHPSSATTPTSKPLTSISKSTTISAPGLTNTNGTGATGTGTGPSYIVNLTLSTTSNNGKSLLTKSRVVSGRSVGEFIDEDGGVEEGQVERWLAGLLGEAGLVGVEEEGAKEE